MAVVTYTVTVAGGAATINPDPTQITLVERDFVIFARSPGTAENIDVRIVGGGPNGEITIAVSGDSQWTVNPNPSVVGGSVVIEFVKSGGGNDPPFPP